MDDRQIYLTDDATIQDYLKFSDFKPALERILLRAHTPLTVGVYGPWGSGKTSLLKMLYREINDRNAYFLRPVWFTAWKYDQHESLWRAFMLRIIDALYPRESEPRDQPREKRDRLLNPTDEKQRQQVAMLDRLEASVYQPVDWQEMGRLVVDWAQAGKAGAGVAAEVAKLFIPGIGIVDTLLKAGNLNENDAALLRRKMQTVHRQQLVEREQFEESFAEAIELILGEDGKDGRLIVFVDDLDRCLPEKAIEVLEAIKLFLSVKGAVFVLGMDREVIQRGIEARYAPFFRQNDVDDEPRELPIRGDSYLQKLIQIPFHLPPLSVDDLGGFIGDLENEGGLRLTPLTRAVFARGLYPNPRQVKRALNIFHLLREIADARIANKDLADDAIQNPLLAKTVVIQTQYPELYQEWRRYPVLVRELEKRYLQQPVSESERMLGQHKLRQDAADDAQTATEGEEERGGGLLDKYLRDRERYALLERMLRYPDDGQPEAALERGRFDGLALDAMAAYVRLAGAVAPEPPTQEVVVTDLGELLSYDWVKIQNALETRDEEARKNPEPLRQQLIQVMQSADREPRERASAGLALGLLGDTRPGVATLEPDLVPIATGLRFLMGEDQQDVPIAQPYAIARYPVTNAQYRYFVEADGYQENQFWTDEGQSFRNEYKWTQPRFWDDDVLALPNLPVVGVSWYEAMAYAAWLAATTGKPYRLPTEAEWERAARYTDGRIYPWGDAWRDGIVNSKETGLERPTAVGAFPAGISQDGVHDLSGNVWEWCQTRWRDENGRAYPQPWRDDGREEPAGDSSVGRVLRGGSWYDSGYAARCAARDWSYPNNRYNENGLRLVLSPLSSSDL
ncbi:MAG: SUMF1/EgtB/PvdO family nonheme iron enzyme [Anaerolineae bacterium]|nr:SUMF1/EgtB/PvdO family nonheme iron enzyme [Anaerolineae bacterium]MCO5192911.1 SUMF1/EgtB/PvdO family nonheme iron enzyme [Anaerolineae bacterium]MCO5198316.1 SUMF1/EgtB/PvdO family nonheme iron enzyme [Anaerolineae bacterium]MCO5205234.1 SUMF1/EgtB/PvdO family nonheme iron enzyme [Anaerolineae bacterium]